MVKYEKTLQKILSGSKNVRFEEFTQLLLALGFVLKRISGSHRIYKHPDVPEVFSVQPDKNSQVKLYQMKKLLTLIETYNLISPETDDEEGEEESE